MRIFAIELDNEIKGLDKRKEYCNPDASLFSYASSYAYNLSYVVKCGIINKRLAEK